MAHDEYIFMASDTQRETFKSDIINKECYCKKLYH